MKDYPQHYQELLGLMKGLSQVAPDTMKAFGGLHKQTLTAGAITTETKELIALGIAIAVRCDGCIAFHVHDALHAGASREAIIETIGVAVMMGGGPAVMYGCEAFAALEQFEKN